MKQERIKKTEVVLVLFLFLFSFLFFIHPLASYDTWFRIFYGKYLSSGNPFPRTEIFVYTVQGNKWISWEALSSIVFYWIYSLSGINGLIIFSAFIGAVSILLLYITGRLKYRASSIFVTTYLFLFIYMYADFVVPRAYIFSVMLFTLLLYILESETPGYRKYIFIFLLFALWSNIHPATYIGILTLAIYALFKKDWFMFLSGFIAISLNPLFIHYYTVPFDLIIKRPYLSEFAQKFIIEYLPLYDFRWRTHATLFVFITFVLSTVGLSFIKRFKPLHWVLIIIFTFLGIKFSRFILFSTIVLYFVILDNVKIYNLKEKYLTFTYIIPFTLIVILLSTGIYLRPDDRRKPRTGIAEDIFPVKAVDFLDNIGYRGRIFNHMSFGHYLEFRGYSPFIDARTDIYTKELIEDFMAPIKNGENYKKIVEKYHIDCFMLNRKEVIYLDNDLNKVLWENPEWGLAYWDDLTLLYLKRSKYPNIAYWNSFNPDLFDRNPTMFFEGGVIKELSKKWEEDPDCFTVYYALSRFYLLKNNSEMAKYILEQGLKRKKHSPLEKAILYNSLGQLLLNEGKTLDALNFFKRASRIRMNEISNYLMGKIYLQLGRKNLARYYLRLSLWQNPKFIPSKKLLNSL